MKLINKNNILANAFAFILVFVGAQFLTACSGGGGGAAGPAVTLNSVAIAEGNSGSQSLTFTVTLSTAAGASTSVDYATADETAVAANGDYTATTDTLTIPAGATTATIDVPVSGDTAFEADETFSLVLSNATGLTLSGTTQAVQGTITNDDNADPKGFYTGSADVNSGTMLTDLVGLVYNNRLLMFSRTGLSNVLYDITFTTITGSDYTGTVNVYVDGLPTQTDVVISSGLTDESQISGTLTGMGLANGTFSLLFDLQNNAGATLDKIDTVMPGSWVGNIYGIDADMDGLFTANQSIPQYVGRDNTNEKCGYGGVFVLPDANLNIYQLAHDIIDAGVGGTCAVPYISAGHTGFASIITTTNPDDTLVYAFNNGDIALFAVLDR